MTTTERLMQLAEAWVEALGAVHDSTTAGQMHENERRAKAAKEAFRSALSSTLEAPADAKRCPICQANSHNPDAACSGPADVGEVCTKAEKQSVAEQGAAAVNLLSALIKAADREAKLNLITAALHAHGTAQRAAGVEAAARYHDDKAAEWMMRASHPAMKKIALEWVEKHSRDAAAIRAIRPDDGEGTK